MSIAGLGTMDSAGLAGDARALEALKHAARNDPQAAARQAAQQFESLFMNMVLKSMREASPKSGMFDSPGMDMAQGMLDQEFAARLAKRGTGLADMIARQIEGGAVAPMNPRQFAPLAPRPAASAAAVPGVAHSLAAAQAYAPDDARGRQREFIARMTPEAQSASAATGIPAQFIVAQAALESGWGRQEIRDPATGATSHNLFGIKAGSQWRGATVDITTTEYVNGQPQKQVERFRAYPSYAAAFEDYARLIATQPRYAAVLGAGQGAEGFAHGLQRAGYATDPEYGNKLLAVIRSTQALGAGR